MTDQAIGTGAMVPQVDSRTRRLLEAPLLSTLLRLAVPNVAVMVTQASIGLIEIYFVAMLGVDALAGVSQVFPVLSLFTAISQGSVGGGFVSAIARTLGKGRQDEAAEFAWYAVFLAVPLGVLTTVLIVACGPFFYTSMGARDASLEAALLYSNVVFGGAILIWLFNLLLATVRGTGNLILPVYVVCGGAVLLVPLSPLLIFGIGGIEGLGVAGGAVAILAYYALGSLCLAVYLWGHKGVLAPRSRPPRVRLQPAWEILRVGGMSTAVSATTNITIAILTGYVGIHGIAAVAGYGAGARLEFLLVPLTYGIGGPAGILIGTSIGAGDPRRALRTAWVSIGIAVVIAEAIGLAAAAWPLLWLGAFSTDPIVLATGSAYLQTTGPFFGFFGLGYALYCTGQGTGRMEWPVAGAIVRAAISIGGGLFVVHAGGGLGGIFFAAGIGMAAFGIISFAGLLLRVGYSKEKTIRNR
ncbi:MAG: family efflux transporter [Reyranella sp.]|nr:family efflux transporter [Reyranella sp.]